MVNGNTTVEESESTYDGTYFGERKLLELQYQGPRWLRECDR
jgi:hypothetical protein